jgi:hypothetical protein
MIPVYGSYRFYLVLKKLCVCVCVLKHIILCKLNGESVDHLFLRCLIAWEMRNLLLYLFGASSVLCNSMTVMLASWKGSLDKLNSGKTWVADPLYLMWCLC